MALPPHQKKGYGKFLIEFSYELSKIEQKSGSPEKPLSDLGMLAYRSYWLDAVLDAIGDRTDVSLQELSRITCILPEDIKSALAAADLLKYYKGSYVLYVPPQVMRDHYARREKQILRVDPSKIHWTPLALPPAVG